MELFLFFTFVFVILFKFFVVDKIPNSCHGNCNQGRNCTCVNKKSKT